MNFNSKNKKWIISSLTLSLSLSLLGLTAFQNCSLKKSDDLNAKGLRSEGMSSTTGTNLQNSTVSTAIAAPANSSQIVLNSDIKCLAPDDSFLPVSKYLKYFGMMTSMGIDTINMDLWKKDVAATLKMGNFQAVEFVPLSNDPTLSNSIELVKQKLSYLSQYNLNIVLVAQRILFDENGKLQTNYTANWSKIMSAITPYKSLIKSVYLYDEPFWNVVVNQKKNNTAFVSSETMYTNLSIAGTLVHNTLPNIPLSYIEAYPMINESLKIPDVFDWIGMDCYTDFENCNGHSLPEYYQILKKLKPGKKLVVLPPAMIFKKSDSILLADRLKVKDLFVKYMNWITSEPDVIASISFIYRYNQTTEVFSGADQICESADIHRLFWRKFYRLSGEGYIGPIFSCSGSGPLNSYSMQGNVQVSNYDVHVPGHYFVGGFNVLNNSWYLYANGQWTKYDGTEATVVSVPSTALEVKHAESLFNQQNLAEAPNGKIYLGYGVGVTKMQAWNNMLTNNQYMQCATLPAK